MMITGVEIDATGEVLWWLKGYRAGRCDDECDDECSCDLEERHLRGLEKVLWYLVDTLRRTKVE